MGHASGTMYTGQTLTKQEWYVYGLLESDTLEVRYVGKTCHPHNRYYTHLGLIPGPRASKVRSWVAGVQARGATIHMRVLAVCDSDFEACELELALIKGGTFSRLVNDIGLSPGKSHKKAPICVTEREPSRAPPELPAGATISERVSHARLLAQWPEPPNTGNP